MSNIGIALDLNSVRIPAARDLAGTLRRVRAAGFDFVQWQGMPQLAPAEIQAALHAVGLTAIAGGVDIETLVRNPQAIIDMWRRLGVPDVAAAGSPEDVYTSASAWRAYIAQLGAFSERFHDAAVRFAYVPSGRDFESTPGSNVLRIDLLIDTTVSRPLYFEFDTCVAENVADYVRKCPSRCPLLAMREVTPAPYGGTLGTGEVDWDATFDAGEEAGVEWYVCCHAPIDDPFANLAASYKFLAERA